MTDTRQTIFNQIRQSLGRQESVNELTRQHLEARLQQHTIHEQPALNLSLLDKFIYQVEKVAGTCEQVEQLSDVPACLMRYLHTQQLPTSVVMDRHLKELAWSSALTVAYRSAQIDDLVSVTHAFAGVAETGSIVMLSSPESPTTLNFLPDVHIVILSRADLLPHIESVWEKLRHTNKAIPRTVNFITGPSRTADIEQTIQLGAHGPRRLHIILVHE
ncbi:LutC/YkgG family protein [Beggiatoa leptomitoformis]|uniref:Lactate utilization protein C n=1 Tax=Beggiatoa leptomitoformis TaxID=288004 RepID=A0A2N9YAB6_9GAMM|nr:LUD domain-containing protein [Beggiatoa leptomitoformis]ALG67190.1 lactate utilization protein C [Beggiatoa leptomitoformis]AUI67403.1 lactate utilization protein C [Beggiatoa leptomitoformis]